RKITLASLILTMWVLLADQVSKWAVVVVVFGRSFGDGALFEGSLPPAGVAVTGFFNLVLFGNKGVAFSLLDGGAGRWLLIVLALGIVVGLAIWLWKVEQWMVGLAIGAIIGGALGNALDRVRFGAVVDFLDFHAFGWHWPSFNVADSSIVVGVGLLLLDGLRGSPGSVE
ncbi:MAG: signal peptidase II, partial [Alphaproteobacteria bacterium]